MEFRRRLNLSRRKILARKQFCETPLARRKKASSDSQRCTSSYQASHVQIRWIVCFRTKHVLSAYTINASHACKQSLALSSFPAKPLCAYFRSFPHSGHVAALSMTDQPSFQSVLIFFFFPYFRRRSLRSIDRIDDKFSPRPITPLLRYPRLTSSFSQNAEDGDKGDTREELI